METLLEMEVPPVIKAWRKRLASAGAKYVMVQTTKVIHDRAAVVEESPENIVVEYPARKGDYSKGVWVIRKDVIPKREIVSMREYQEDKSTSDNS